MENEKEVKSTFIMEFEPEENEADAAADIRKDNADKNAEL